MNYFSYKPGFIGVFWRNNLARIEYEAYVINLDDKSNVRTHCASWIFYKSLAVYFDSFGIEYIPLEVLSKFKDISIAHNIFRIQDNESIMSGF